MHSGARLLQLEKSLHTAAKIWSSSSVGLATADSHCHTAQEKPLVGAVAPGGVLRCGRRIRDYLRPDTGLDSNHPHSRHEGGLPNSQKATAAAAATLSESTPRCMGIRAT